MLRLNRHSGQGAIARPLRVLVAAPQPLHRELVRFFLEDAGCQVVALVASGEDAVSLVASKRPDAVILHESLVVAMVGAGLIQRIHRGSTSTKIVVVTPQPELAWSGPSRGADAFVEEWIGIQELGLILPRLCRGAPVPVQPARVYAERGTAGSSPAGGQGEVLPSPPRAVDPPVGWQTRWYEPIRGAAAASVILILLLLGRGLLQLPATSEGPGSPASAHLTNAYSTLEVLVESMRAGRSGEAIAETARRLIAERAAALASGADTTRLDAAIDAEVSPLLSSVTDEGAAAIESVLGDLVSTQGPPSSLAAAIESVLGNLVSTQGPPPSLEPGPAEVPSPEPSPTERSGPKQSPNPEESPTAEASPSPEPSETPSPEPSPTETLSPSGTASPDVSPTESPSPSESQSPEPSESASPSTPGPTAVPAIPTAAGLVLGSLTLLSWMRARVRKRSGRLSAESSPELDRRSWVPFAPKDV